MVNRLWYELTGSWLPGIDVVPHRRSAVPLCYETVRDSPVGRTREALRQQLRAHGVWPGRIHVVVEGQTEERWVRGLLRASLGVVPRDVLITNLHGTGAAKRMEPIVDAIADQAGSTALIVDAEGDMGRYVRTLVSSALVDERDVLMVGTSFEEANFSYGELLRVVRHIGANPPGNRRRWLCS